jgi:ABC-type thiamine transport system substrate-binding protein
VSRSVELVSSRPGEGTVVGGWNRRYKACSSGQVRVVLRYSR